MKKLHLSDWTPNHITEEVKKEFRLIRIFIREGGLNIWHLSISAS